MPDNAPPLPDKVPTQAAHLRQLAGSSYVWVYPRREGTMNIELVQDGGEMNAFVYPKGDNNGTKLKANEPESFAMTNDGFFTFQPRSQTWRLDYDYQ